MLDKHALTLGINLLPDFYQKACNLHLDVLENAKKQNEAEAELLMVNFGLRSKVFINNKDLQDALFEKLFEMNYQELTEAESLAHRGVLKSDMSVYTAWFLKILIKTLQSSNRCFDVTIIKRRIQDLVVNERLVVATNSLPMFLVVQMFFSTE